MKKRILSILAIGLLVANVQAANVATAKDNGKKDAKIEKSNEDSKGANVTYVGETTDSGIVFDVNYANPTGQRFLLVLTNTQGEVLFDQSFKGSDFHKTIMIKKDSDVSGTVKFSVRSNGSEVYSKAFQIDTEAKVVRNVVVTPIK